MNSKQTPKLAALLLVAVLPGFGEDTTAWSRVEAQQRGSRMGVVRTNQTRAEGRFDSANASAIALDSGGLILIPREEVVRVYRIGVSRKRKMLIGAAAGLATGATVAVTLSRRLNNEGFFAGSNGAAGAAAAVAGGAGIGIAAGSLTGSGYETIYQKQGGR